MAKTRKCKLSGDAKANVKIVATYKLNRFLSAAKGLGNCCGPMFDYSGAKMTPEQIADLILSVSTLAAENIRKGAKTTAVSGLQL